jgi:hypothetical protein
MASPSYGLSNHGGCTLHYAVYECPSAALFRTACGNLKVLPIPFRLNEI